MPRYMRYMSRAKALSELYKVTNFLEKADKKYMPQQHVPLHIAKTINASMGRYKRLQTYINTQFE